MFRVVIIARVTNEVRLVHINTNDVQDVVLMAFALNRSIVPRSAMLNLEFPREENNVMEHIFTRSQIMTHALKLYPCHDL